MKTLALALVLASASVSAHAASGLTCQEVKGGSAVAAYDHAANLLTVNVNGVAGAYSVKSVANGLLGSVVITGVDANGSYAMLNVSGSKSPSLLQALGGSAYMSCTVNN